MKESEMRECSKARLESEEDLSMRKERFEDAERESEDKKIRKRTP